MRLLIRALLPYLLVAIAAYPVFAQFNMGGGVVNGPSATLQSGGGSASSSAGTANQVETSTGVGIAIKSQPVRLAPFIGTPTASAANWAMQCLDSLTFPANFSGTYPDASASASCGTNPREADSYTVKVAGSSIGTAVLGNPVQQAGATTGSTSFTVSMGSNVTAGNTLVIFYSQETNQTPTFSLSSGTATLGSFSLCPSSPVHDGTQVVGVILGYAKVTGSGSATIQASIGAGDPQAMTVAEFNAVVTTSPSDACGSGSTNTGTALSTGNTGTTSNSNDLIVGVFGSQCSSCTISGVSSGFNQLASQSTSTIDEFGVWQAVSATGNYSASATLSASNIWAAVALALKMNSSACNGANFTTNSGATQTCSAGQRLELDAPSTVSGANIAVSLPAHTP